MRHLTSLLITAGILAMFAGSLQAGVINEDLELLASDGSGGDWFGCALAIDDGVIAVGAWRDDDHGTSSGSAYLLNASTGAQILKLVPADGEFEDRFGWSIAIDNGIVAIGASQDDDNALKAGSAYLFDASSGVQLAKLLSSDGEPHDSFGHCIALDNGVVAVGAPFDIGGDPGSAYLFNASTGAEIAILLPEDNPAGAQFGISIAIDNGIVAVGAYLDNENGAQSGSVYLFDASTGAQLAKLLPGDGAAGDYFGDSIDIKDGIVAVGARRSDDNGTDSGSAYLFDASTEAQLAKLLPVDGVAFDWFGGAISIDNGVIAVAATGVDGSATDSGSAYLFDASTGKQLAKLLQSDGDTFDAFGHSIASQNGVVSVGAIAHDHNGPDSGSVYLFDAGAPCSADLDGTGTIDAADLAAMLGAWGPNPGHPADLNGDGFVNAADLAILLGAWGGCP